MKKFVFIVLLLSFGSVKAESYPALLDVVIGQAFEHPNALFNKDTRRPTTQYRVPNYGETKQIFQEYEVAYLNNSNAVAIVTGKVATKNLGECEKQKEKLAKLVKSKFPNYQETPVDKSNLGGPDEYSRHGANTYYVIQCQGSYGPFSYLSFQIRGIEEDRQLKAAWSEFFGKNER